MSSEEMQERQLRTHGDGVWACDQAIASYNAQIEELEEERQRIRGNLDSLTDKQDAGCHELAVSLLPIAEPGIVEAAGRQLGMPSLMETWQEMHDQQVSRQVERNQIEAKTDFQEREQLASPNGGLLVLEERELQDNLETLRHSACDYVSNQDFLKLYRDRGEGEPSLFWKLLSYLLIFGLVLGLAKKKRQERAERAFGKTLGMCFDDYDQTVVAINQTNERLGQVQERLNDIRQMEKRHWKLTALITGFRTDCRNRLRAETVGHLANIQDFSQLRDRLGEKAKLPLTQLVVLTEKRSYLEKMDDFLTGEIHDRQKRISSITSVRYKWSRRPYKSLHDPEGKRKWLLEIPAAKARTTSKRTRFVHVIHGNVWGFEDYLLYGMMLDSLGYDGFLPFDVFSHYGEECMPYDGFVNEVLPEVGEWRDEHGPADFGSMDEAYGEAYPEEAADSSDADAAVAAAAGYGLADALDEADYAEEAMDTNDTDGDFADVS